MAALTLLFIALTIARASVWRRSTQAAQPRHRAASEPLGSPADTNRRIGFRLLRERTWELHQILTMEDEVNDAVFSPDGTRVLTASEDATARIWDARTGEPIGKPLQHADSVLQAAFSPDGTRVLTASVHEKARIWDARTGEPSARHCGMRPRSRAPPSAGTGRGW
jgi:WD40 repeat protein